MIFTPEEREALREALIARARTDPRITGAAMTGSASVGREDRWSDVDLAFGIADGVPLHEPLADWTEHMERQHGAVHHLDVPRGPAIYRVFLLPSTLQVDLAFFPAAAFVARGETFRLLFGTHAGLAPAGPPTVAHLAGLGWLHALHARTCIQRGRPWQAEYMISGIRDTVVTLACVRHGLPWADGRGVDALPAEVAAPLAGALVAALDPGELRRAFGVAGEALLAEVRAADPDLHDRIAGTVRELMA